MKTKQKGWLQVWGRGALKKYKITNTKIRHEREYLFLNQKIAANFKKLANTTNITKIIKKHFD